MLKALVTLCFNRRTKASRFVGPIMLLLVVPALCGSMLRGAAFGENMTPGYPSSGLPIDKAGPGQLGRNAQTALKSEARELEPLKNRPEGVRRQGGQANKAMAGSFHPGPLNLPRPGSFNNSPSGPRSVGKEGISMHPGHASIPGHTGALPFPSSRTSVLDPQSNAGRKSYNPPTIGGAATRNRGSMTGLNGTEMERRRITP